MGTRPHPRHIPIYQAVDPNRRRDPIKPWEGPLRFTADHLPLLDAVAAEHTQIGGVAQEIELYLIDLSPQYRDPLYGEAVERKFDGPYRMPGTVVFADNDLSTEMEGQQTSNSTNAWIARVELEKRGLRLPQEGDILGLWNTPFINDNYAVPDYDLEPGARFWYNVIDTGLDGVVFSNPKMVGVKLTLQRTTDFTPERRVERLR